MHADKADWTDSVIVMMNTGGIAGTNCYLVADDASKQAVLFDVPDNTVAPLLDDASRRGFELIGLWVTHGHFDHVADHQRVTDRFPQARVLIHFLDAPKLREPGSSSFILPFVIPPREPDGFVEDGQSLQIGSLGVKVIHTPGHSPGHVAYHFPAEKVLIGGDLIIMGAVGRTDLPDSDPAALDASIRRVMRLPDETSLLPGHGQKSSLGEERRSNEFVMKAMRES